MYALKLYEAPDEEMDYDYSDNGGGGMVNSDDEEAMYSEAD